MKRAYLLQVVVWFLSSS